MPDLKACERIFAIVKGCQSMSAGTEVAAAGLSKANPERVAGDNYDDTPLILIDAL